MLSVPLFGGIPGGPEVLVILLIAVLLFGANKIPKLARSTGEAMGEFQKGREQVEQELQEMREGTSSEGATGERAAATTTGEPTSGATSGSEATSGTEAASESGSETASETETGKK